RSMTITEEGQLLTMVASLSRESVEVKNVGGVLPGNDEIVVVGAHYDHLGYGQSGSLDEKTNVIHNGADDNASGVAGVIEAARLIKARPTSATFLFVTFTAEETGLGGSNHLVKNFPFEMENVRAMINLDMVGRMNDKRLVLQACKTAEEFDAIVEEANKPLGLEITCKGDGYGPSDHMSFYLEEKPVLFLFTGAHEDYHKSTDDTEKINFEGLEYCTKLTANLAEGIADHPTDLTYVKAEAPQSPGGGAYRVSFGSIPDFAQPDTLIGVLLSGAREGGPAANAGIRKGDLLTKMGDVILNNLYDLVFALKTYAPGDTVEVHYIREGEEQVTYAVLAAPK
ncbi:M20/M25/M40 family metallo-hydrolase, partial [bacterium]|nr:M20/M25/M40 family metallo-hydrolase [bacterium]MBU1920940.1 M20/M25/M40 family metallo-hydrolase [bacterium]